MLGSKIIKKAFLMILLLIPFCQFHLLNLSDQNNSMNLHNINLNSMRMMNISIVSDGFMEKYWNNNTSTTPSIVVENSGKIHIVWEDFTEGIWGEAPFDTEIMYCSYTKGFGWSNVTVISDGYNSEYWNNDTSSSPSIGVDPSGKIHVVWEDYTNGIWGVDSEIMYVSYTESIGWSNITILSDNETNWNNDNSVSPKIALDTSGKIHVVWLDYTNGIWGTDPEIMYISSINGVEWTNPIVISDDITNWNNGSSYDPSITVDGSGKIYVVWEDDTIGFWGGGLFDTEIMYASSTDGISWSNATIISDGFNGEYWNNDTSADPSIKIDTSGKIHVVWEDYTDGIWGVDTEIMYASSTDGISWSNATIISDGYNGEYWNNDTSIDPSIAIDSFGRIHVVWEDHTDGIWGVDSEIMYVSYVESEWCSNITIISDDVTDWNNGFSAYPEIFIDNYDNVHIVWDDNTDGIWGIDSEIMYILLIQDKNIFQNDFLLIIGIGIGLGGLTTIIIYFIFKKGRFRVSLSGKMNKIKDMSIGDSYNHNELLELCKKENLIEYLIDKKGLNWTAFNESFIDNIDKLRWDYNEKVEFLRELASLKPKERSKMIREINEKMMDL
ncbi:MAG: hypothetical protein JXA99_07975 [Candidatus Lokiarchaeota archaeon]|nr:hypothetical protein [Candidatus Lokiarchaeota archaeon]